MSTSPVTIEEPRVSRLDTCDRCCAAPMWQVSMLSGPLLFCDHHYRDMVKGGIKEKALSIQKLNWRD